MRALIAVTCVAVLTVVGYYFWGEYRLAQHREADRERIERARSELFGLAEAERGDVERVRGFCRSVDSLLDDPVLRDNREFWRGIIRNCRGLGYF
jgi:hypothetical protein